MPAVIHTVHGAPFHPYQGRAVALVFSGLRAAGPPGAAIALVSVADAMTELMVAGGVAPREKFTTIYSGMEVEPFLRVGHERERVRRELGYRPENVVIGKVARLFRLKGHDDVIRAARGVVDAQPNVRFLFVGDGLLRSPLERQIAAAGLGEYFQFTGLVSPERIPGLIAASDMIVHASLREGLARVLPQALIAGKPVVSYDVDGAREVVLPDETGFLVPPRDIQALAGAEKSGRRPGAAGSIRPRGPSPIHRRLPARADDGPTEGVVRTRVELPNEVLLIKLHR